MRKYGSKQVSKKSQRAALEMMLKATSALDRLDPESLSRSYGITATEAQAMLSFERKRREWAA